MSPRSQRIQTGSRPVTLETKDYEEFVIDAGSYDPNAALRKGGAPNAYLGHTGQRIPYNAAIALPSLEEVGASRE